MSVCVCVLTHETNILILVFKSPKWIRAIMPSTTLFADDHLLIRECYNRYGIDLAQSTDGNFSIRSANMTSMPELYDLDYTNVLHRQWRRARLHSRRSRVSVRSKRVCSRRLVL